MGLITKLVLLAAAISVILLMNWYVSKKFFIFRNGNPPFPLFVLCGLVVVVNTLLLPFAAMIYLTIWMFGTQPKHSAILFYSHLLWLLPTLAMSLRNSSKYWTNRR